VQRERWERLERLFSHGLALAKPERTAWLERACADDAELRCEVEELLLADAVHGVLDTSPFATDDAEATAIAPSPGEGHTRRRRSRNARDEIERSGLVEDRELHSSSADLIEGELRLKRHDANAALPLLQGALAVREVLFVAPKSAPRRSSNLAGNLLSQAGQDETNHGARRAGAATTRTFPAQRPLPAPAARTAGPIAGARGIGLDPAAHGRG
jgi:hypothetical protein